jgi:hypothetical protein
MRFFVASLIKGTSNNGMTNDDSNGVAAGLWSGGAYRTSVSASQHYFFKVEDEWNLAFSI